MSFKRLQPKLIFATRLVRTPFLTGLFVFAFLIAYFLLPISSPANAVAGINQQINFQGRLLNSSSVVVADGSYNQRFRIHCGGDGILDSDSDTVADWTEGVAVDCTHATHEMNLWTEELKQANRVTVKNGYFSVMLGAVTAFASTVDWNQDELYLSVDIGGTADTPTPTYDGEMSPFKRLAANPYALNSKYLGGLDQTQFVQLAQGVQTDSSAANPSIFINKTGTTANILQLRRNGDDKLVVSNDGHTTVGGNLTVVANTTLSGTVTLGVIQGGSPLSFEGATANDFETTFAITDPTVDRTITFPNADITVNAAGQLSGDTLAAGVITSSLTTVAGLIAGSITSGFGAIDVGVDNIITTGTLQGSTVTSPSATNLTLDSATGTIAIASTDTTIQKSGTALSIDLNDASNATLTVTNSNGSAVGSLDVEGDVNIGSGQIYKIGGTQISSSGFSDLAKLATSQTFTGTNTFQPTTNITSLVVKQTSNASPTADIFNLQTTNSTNILQATSVAANSSAVTLQSVGSNALTLNSGSGTIVLGSDTTTLQKVGTAFTLDLNNASASTLTVTNSGAGAGHLSVKTSVLTPLLDTPSGTTTLNIGTTNATVGINLNQSTAIAAAKNFTVTSGATDLKGATGGTALTVTNSAAGTGTIALFKDNTTTVATIADGGAVTLQNQANSTSALAVLNAAGTTIVKVDTTNSALLPGASPVAGAVTQSSGDHNDSAQDYIDMVIGNDGMAYISYYSGGSGGDSLHLERCTNKSCTTSTTQIIDGAASCPAGCDTDADTGELNSMALDPTTGFPIIAYFEQSNDNGTTETNDIKYVKCTAVDCSTASYQTIDTNAGSEPSPSTGIGESLDMAVGVDGLPIIVYKNDLSELTTEWCNSLSCTTTTKTTHDTGVDVDNIKIAIGTDGLPIISYLFTGTQGLKTIKCTTITCSASATPTTIESGVGSGREHTMAIGPDGNPALFYYFNDTITDNNEFAACTNTSCTTQTHTTIETLTTIGQENDMIFAADGLPMVSSHLPVTGLKVLKCGNRNCTSGNTISPKLHSTGISATAMVLGDDGLPLIAFADLTNGLKTIKCATPTCAQSADVTPISGGSFTGGTSIGSTGNFFNNIYAAQFWGRQFQIANFDLAEEYPVNDPTIGPGDVVCTDQSGSLAVTRCPATSNPSLSLTPMGIVSTKPAITLGDWPTQDRTNLRPIALAGRVPTKVTAENGPIAIGDYLTTSPTKPGYATKAIYPGPTIGTALEPLTCPVIPTVVEGSNPDCTGTITVFVKSSYYDPSTQLQGNLRTFDAINVTGVATVQELKVIGSTTLASLTVTGHLTTGPDTSGTITIPAGQTSATYTFAQAYGGVPNVVVSPERKPEDLNIWATASQTSFTATISQSLDYDLVLTYLATEANHE